MTTFSACQFKNKYKKWQDVHFYIFVYVFYNITHNKINNDLSDDDVVVRNYKF